MKYKYPIGLGFAVLFVGVFVSGFLDWAFLVPHIDNLYHFVGGIALGWFFYIYFSFETVSFSKFKKIIIVVSATCFVAVLWEYAERLSTIYSPEHARWLYHWFKGGDLTDTLLDILAGITGGLAFALLGIDK